MTLRELAAEAGVTPRHIRFLIAEDLCPPPAGGRRFAEYGEEHLTAIRHHQYLQKLGFPLAAIKRLRQAKRGFPFPVADGITLLVAPERIGAGDPVEPIVERVREELEQVLGTGSKPSPDPAPTGRPARAASPIHPSRSSADGAAPSPAPNAAPSAAAAPRPTAGDPE